jgi:hypothetical protein
VKVLKAKREKKGVKNCEFFKFIVKVEVKKINNLESKLITLKELKEEHHGHACTINNIKGEKKLTKICENLSPSCFTPITIVK